MTKAFLFFFCICSAFQQVSAERGEKPLSVKLSFLSWEKISQDLRIRMASGDVSIRVSNTRPSEPIVYRGENPVRFFSIGKSLEGEEIRKEVGRVYLRKKWSEALLVFTAEGEIIPIQYDASIFSHKDLCCLNLSKRALALMVGSEKAQLGPGESIMLDSGDGLLPIKIAALSGSDGWRLVRSSNIHLYRKQKPLLILRDGGQSNAGVGSMSRSISEPEVLFRVVQTKVNRG